MAAELGDTPAQVGALPIDVQRPIRPHEKPCTMPPYHGRNRVVEAYHSVTLPFVIGCEDEDGAMEDGAEKWADVLDTPTGRSVNNLMQLLLLGALDRDAGTPDMAMLMKTFKQEALKAAEYLQRRWRRDETERYDGGGAAPPAAAADPLAAGARAPVDRRTSGDVSLDKRARTWFAPSSTVNWRTTTRVMSAIMHRDRHLAALSLMDPACALRCVTPDGAHAAPGVLGGGEYERRIVEELGLNPPAGGNDGDAPRRRRMNAEERWLGQVSRTLRDAEERRARAHAERLRTAGELAVSILRRTREAQQAERARQDYEVALAGARADGDEEAALRIESAWREISVDLPDDEREHGDEERAVDAAPLGIGALLARAAGAGGPRQPAPAADPDAAGAAAAEPMDDEAFMAELFGPADDGDGDGDDGGDVLLDDGRDDAAVEGGAAPAEGAWAAAAPQGSAPSRRPRVVVYVTPVCEQVPHRVTGKPKRVARAFMVTFLYLDGMKTPDEDVDRVVEAAARREQQRRDNCLRAQQGDRRSGGGGGGNGAPWKEPYPEAILAADRDPDALVRRVTHQDVWAMLYQLADAPDRLRMARHSRFAAKPLRAAGHPASLSSTLTYEWACRFIRQQLGDAWWAALPPDQAALLDPALHTPWRAAAGAGGAALAARGGSEPVGHFLPAAAYILPPSLHVYESATNYGLRGYYFPWLEPTIMDKRRGAEGIELRPLREMLPSSQHVRPTGPADRFERSMAKRMRVSVERLRRHPEYEQLMGHQQSISTGSVQPVPKSAALREFESASGYRVFASGVRLRPIHQALLNMASMAPAETEGDDVGDDGCTVTDADLVLAGMVPGQDAHVLLGRIAQQEAAAGRDEWDLPRDAVRRVLGGAAAAGVPDPQQRASMRERLARWRSVHGTPWKPCREFTLHLAHYEEAACMEWRSMWNARAGLPPAPRAVVDYLAELREKRGEQALIAPPLYRTDARMGDYFACWIAELSMQMRTLMGLRDDPSSLILMQTVARTAFLIRALMHHLYREGLPGLGKSYEVEAILKYMMVAGTYMEELSASDQAYSNGNHEWCVVKRMDEASAVFTTDDQESGGGSGGAAAARNAAQLAQAKARLSSGVLTRARTEKVMDPRTGVERMQTTWVTTIMRVTYIITANLPVKNAAIRDRILLTAKHRRAHTAAATRNLVNTSAPPEVKAALQRASEWWKLSHAAVSTLASMISAQRLPAPVMIVPDEFGRRTNELLAELGIGEDRSPRVSTHFKNICVSLTLQNAVEVAFRVPGAPCFGKPINEVNLAKAWACLGYVSKSIALWAFTNLRARIVHEVRHNIKRHILGLALNVAGGESALSDAEDMVEHCPSALHLYLMRLWAKDRMDCKPEYVRSMRTRVRFGGEADPPPRQPVFEDPDEAAAPAPAGGPVAAPERPAAASAAASGGTTGSSVGINYNYVACPGSLEQMARALHGRMADVIGMTESGILQRLRDIGRTSVRMRDCTFAENDSLMLLERWHAWNKGSGPPSADVVDQFLDANLARSMRDETERDGPLLVEAAREGVTYVAIMALLDRDGDRFMNALTGLVHDGWESSGTYILGVREPECDVMETWSLPADRARRMGAAAGPLRSHNCRRVTTREARALGMSSRSFGQHLAESGGDAAAALRASGADSRDYVSKHVAGAENGPAREGEGPASGAPLLGPDGRPADLDWAAALECCVRSGFRHSCTPVTPAYLMRRSQAYIARHGLTEHQRERHFKYPEDAYASVQTELRAMGLDRESVDRRRIGSAAAVPGSPSPGTVARISDAPLFGSALRRANRRGKAPAAPRGRKRIRDAPAADSAAPGPPVRARRAAGIDCE